MKLLSPRKVAKRLGTTEAALAQMRYTKTGPRYVKINARSVKYREDDIDQWIQDRTVETENPRGEHR